MLAKVKFGCLCNTTSLNAGRHPMSNVKTYLEEFQCERMSFELPESGTETAEFSCPFCANAVAIRLSSLAKAQSIWQIVFVVAGAVCLGIGLFMYLSMGDNIAGYTMGGIFGGIGILWLVAAYFCDKLPASWIKEGMVKIGRDEVMNQMQGPGLADRRRHKLLELYLEESEAMPRGKKFQKENDASRMV